MCLLGEQQIQSGCFGFEGEKIVLKGEVNGGASFGALCRFGRRRNI